MEKIAYAISMKSNRHIKFYPKKGKGIWTEKKTPFFFFISRRNGEFFHQADRFFFHFFSFVSLLFRLNAYNFTLCGDTAFIRKKECVGTRAFFESQSQWKVKEEEKKVSSFHPQDSWYAFFSVGIMRRMFFCSGFAGKRACLWVCWSHLSFSMSRHLV